MEQTSMVVMIWWAGLSAIAFFNICLLLYTRKALTRRKPKLSADVFQIRKWQFVFAAIYVLGCGFRSLLPRSDVLRIVLFDSWLSSILVGRSVATIAELAFVTQWALLLHEIGKAKNITPIAWLARLIIPMIILAELFSWYGVLTKNCLGNTIEESIWAITAGITVAGFIIARPRYQKSQRIFLNAGILLGVAYILYMVTIDVPAYFRHYQESEAAGLQYLSLSQGFSEVASLWTVVRTFDSWRYPMVWMSLYFSVAVWISLTIVNGPSMAEDATSLCGGGSNQDKG